jgi:histidyl-tRNA synthetase
MNDILPEASHIWQHLERQIAGVVNAYGYREIRLPLVEETALFNRAIGEVTDIVEKEMYSFPDRKGGSLTLRPEGTAGCVRAVNQHGLAQGIQKLWYAGPMFRYERPQKGRQRQFHQVGVEVFGAGGADVEAELILLGARLWRVLGIDGVVELQLNSLGDLASRDRYRQALLTYLRDVEADLDEDSQRRLDTNPLRVLDSKSPQTQALLEAAPMLPDYLDTESAEHFARLQELLRACGVEYQLNTRLVRGLDYYNRTVFEWVTEALGAQGAICAGGRYDGLVEQLGGKPTAAAGFAMGLERLVLLMQDLETAPQQKALARVYFVAGGAAAESEAFRLAEAVRDRVPGQPVLVNSGGGSIKSQMKRADKSGAQFAIIIGDRELETGCAGLKMLRADVVNNEQLAIPFADLAARVCELIEDEEQ